MSLPLKRRRGASRRRNTIARNPAPLRRGRGNGASSLLGSSNSPWYQKQHQISIPGVNITYTTSAGGGLVAVLSVSTALVQNFDAWSQVFDEYRLLKCDFWFTFLQSGFSAPGACYAYMDEDDNTSPNLSTCTSHGADLFVLSTEASQRMKNRRSKLQHSGPVVSYHPRSFIDEDWFNSSLSPVAFAYLKIFIPNVATNPSQPTLIVSAHPTFSFRGFQTPAAFGTSRPVIPHTVSFNSTEHFKRINYHQRLSVPSDFCVSGSISGDLPGCYGGCFVYKDPGKDPMQKPL